MEKNADEVPKMIQFGLVAKKNSEMKEIESDGKIIEDPGIGVSLSPVREENLERVIVYEDGVVCEHIVSADQPRFN